MEGDDREVFNLPKSLLLEMAREGDVIRILAEVAPGATKAHREKVMRLLKFDR